MLKKEEKFVNQDLKHERYVAKKRVKRMEQMEKKQQKLKEKARAKGKPVK